MVEGCLPRPAGRRRFVKAGVKAVIAAAAATRHPSPAPAACETNVLPWLAEVQRPPAGFVVGSVAPLPPLVPGGTADGVCPNAAEWSVSRRRLERMWLELLGGMPPPPPLALEVLREDDVEGCRRRLVRYACETGIAAEAFLLFPPPDAPPGLRGRGRPGVVAFHSTIDSTNECIAGLRDGPDRRLAVALARRGFVTVCPRCFLWQEPVGYEELVRRFRARHPDALGIRKMLYDGSRAIDVLLATEGVDSDRIGCCGHSLGAKEALYLAAFDRRIRATVAHDGGLGRRQSNWNAAWYLGPDVPPQFDHHQLLALAAPHPLLVQGGGPGAADGPQSWPFVAAALPVYRLYPGPVGLGLDIHGGGHKLTDRAVSRLIEWLAVHLSA